MSAKFGSFSSPADEAATVTKSDTTTFDPPARGLYVGGTGNVAVRMAGGSKTVVTFEAVPAGAVLPISVDRVMSTNTTATLIVRLW